MCLDKNATPSDGACSLAECLEDIQPKAFLAERRVDDVGGPSAKRAGALGRYGDLHANTSSVFVNQWHPRFISQAFCLAIPRMASGLEFPNQDRWRRIYNDAPRVSVFDFTEGLPRHVEGKIRKDWTLVPAVRNLWFRHTAEHNDSLMSPF